MDLPSVPGEMQFGGLVEDVNIGSFVTVGAHSCILPGVKIPEGSAYGAFTLVKKSLLKPYHLYAGIKCNDLGKRDLSEIKKLERFK